MTGRADKALLEPQTKAKRRLGGSYLFSLFLSVAAALLVGALIMLATGSSPIEGYGALLKGAFGSPRGLGNTLAKSVTLCVCGLATAVAARAGIFNVGGEGQLYLGGLAAAVVGYTCYGLSPFIAVPLAFLAAMAAGGLYAYIPGVLKVKFKVNEVITTVMLNTAAIYLCSYMANGPLKTAEKGIASGTPAIDPAFRFTNLIPLSNLTQSVVYAGLIAIIVWYVMTKTSAGYEMKLTGQNRRFAIFSGIKSDRLTILAMVASGAMCGLVGLFEVYGIHGRFVETLSKDFYFDGLLVAMIMRYNPVGIVFMSVFFGALKVGSSAMELNVGISSELILVVQSIIIFFMAAQSGISRMLRENGARRRAQRHMRKERENG